MAVEGENPSLNPLNLLLVWLATSATSSSLPLPLRWSWWGLLARTGTVAGAVVVGSTNEAPALGSVAILRGVAADIASCAMG